MSYTRAWLDARAVPESERLDAFTNALVELYESRRILEDLPEDYLDGTHECREDVVDEEEWAPRDSYEEALEENKRLKEENEQLKAARSKLEIVVRKEALDDLRAEIERLNERLKKEREAADWTRKCYEARVKELEKQLRAKPPTDLQAYRKLAAIRKLLDDVSPSGTADAKPAIEGVKKAGRLARKKGAAK